MQLALCSSPRLTREHTGASRREADTHTHTHTHTHTQLESNPGKTRKNATLENVGPTEITEACRQTAGAPTRGIRLQISQHLTRRKIGIAHASAPRTHAHARCPAAIPAQHGTAPAAAGTGPTPAIRGKGGRDGRRGPVRQRFGTRDQPREEKLPSVGDRQKTTKTSRSGDPETSLRGHEADEKR